MMIDITYDFRSDTPPGKDPDFYSQTMREYHRLLWSKPLPNGEIMQLEKIKGRSDIYLRWRDINFGSDSIIISFRYNKKLMEGVRKTHPDVDAYLEDLSHKAYTAGGTIIFPMHSHSINQRRGVHVYIRDRFDLTLECIRKYYLGEESPLYKGLLADKAFFDLFVDFKGYVDFFFLNDCVKKDYSKVFCWCGNMNLNESAFPKTIDAYWAFQYHQMEFLGRRNQRILEYAQKHNL